MAYKVIQAFVDLQDGDRVYRVGDVYEGTDEDRIKDLLSEESKGRHESLMGVSLIESDGEDLLKEEIELPETGEEVEIPEETKKPKKAKK